MIKLIKGFIFGLGIVAILLFAHPASITNTNLHVITYGKNLFVAVGHDEYGESGVILTSPDGKVWTEGLLKKCLLLSLRGAIATKQSKKVRNNEANAEIASKLCLSQ
jgi:hypothetical protein